MIKSALKAVGVFVCVEDDKERVTAVNYSDSNKVIFIRNP